MITSYSPAKNLGSFFFFHRFCQGSRQQAYPYPCIFKSSAKRAIMLFRQDLSRRHHSGLIAVFRHEIAKRRRNHCFSASDISLYQTIHRYGTMKVLHNPQTRFCAPVSENGDNASKPLQSYSFIDTPLSSRFRFFSSKIPNCKVSNSSKPAVFWLFPTHFDSPENECCAEQN